MFYLEFAGAARPALRCPPADFWPLAECVWDEILFGNGIEDYFNADPELAARSTVDNSLLFGINTLCDNKRAFVNCTVRCCSKI
jgi:hypothetical protein